MIVPKRIVDKIIKMQTLRQEIATWFNDNDDNLSFTTDGNPYQDGMHTDQMQIVDEPKGDKQCDGTYCDQHNAGAPGIDWFYGNYYYKLYNGKYLKVPFNA